MNVLKPKSNHMFIAAHKQPQLTCQADMVVDTCLTSNVALFVPPSGTVHSTITQKVFHFSNGSDCMLVID